MALEDGNKISELVATNPEGGDPVSKGDDHIRMIKKILKSSILLLVKFFGLFPIGISSRMIVVNIT